jgi:hypothetical protein
VVLVLGIITRNHVYADIVYPFYDGKILPGVFSKFYLVMRCVLTRTSQEEGGRSTLRNIVFNSLRQVFPLCWYNVLVHGKGMPDLEQVVPLLMDVVIVTVGLQFIPKSLIRRFRFLYYYLAAEYYFGFPFSFVTLVNYIHSAKAINSDLLMGMLAISMSAHNRLGWFYVEDLIFGDINSWANASNIIATSYLMYIFGWPLHYFMQIHYLGNPLQLHLQSEASLVEMVVSPSSRPRLTGFIPIDFKISEHKEVMTVQNVQFGIWIWFILYCIVHKKNKELKLYDTLKNVELLNKKMK